jgi:hypothetical protein
MAYYDTLMGWLHNRGHKDTDNLEIKASVGGTLSFMKVAGWPDNPRALSKDQVVLHNDQYERLGTLRVDDPPFLLWFFCTTGQLNHITFRYTEGDATRAVKYLVTRDKDKRATISREFYFGMDEKNFKEMAVRWTVWLSIVLGVLILAYWQWDNVVIYYHRLRGHPLPAQATATGPTTPSATQPSPIPSASSPVSSVPALSSGTTPPTTAAPAASTPPPTNTPPPAQDRDGTTEQPKKKKNRWGKKKRDRGKG